MFCVLPVFPQRRHERCNTIAPVDASFDYHIAFFFFPRKENDTHEFLSFADSTTCHAAARLHLSLEAAYELLCEPSDGLQGAHTDDGHTAALGQIAGDIAGRGEE